MVSDNRRVLLVGVGGLGSPVATILAKSGVQRFTLVDSDIIERSNLHRQVLFNEADVGSSKVARGAARLRSLGAMVEEIEGRLLPENALNLIADHGLVVEGADNFATKFLTADACALSNTPVVQAGAIRWGGWAMASVPGQSACLRCVFEDIPTGRPETCAIAGVVGPVVGVIGALQASLALGLMEGDGVSAAGQLWSYDGLRGRLRRRPVQRRPGCPLCEGRLLGLPRSRYLPGALASELASTPKPGGV